MTQQKRIAEEDLNRCKLNGGFIYDEVLPYWIKEAEAQRIRAEEAEQERDKLRSNLRMIKNSIEQFKKAVSLLDFQLEGYGLYEERDDTRNEEKN